MIKFITPYGALVTASAALALALGALSAHPAQAATYYTVNGQVFQGEDDDGFFGLAGHEAVGQAFTATFIREDVYGATYTNDLTYSGVEGFGAYSPVHGSITINGVSYAFGSYLGLQSQTVDPNHCGVGCRYDSFDLEAEDYVNEFNSDTGDNFLSGGVGFQGFSVNTPFLANADYHSLFSLNAQEHVYLDGFVLMESYTGQPGMLDHRYVDLLLTPTSLLVTEGPPQPAGVPEPAGWALMILGFGAAGAMLRRRGAGGLPRLSR